MGKHNIEGFNYNFEEPEIFAQKQTCCFLQCQEESKTASVFMLNHQDMLTHACCKLPSLQIRITSLDSKLAKQQTVYLEIL